MEARLAPLADHYQSPATKARPKLQPFIGARFAQEIGSPIGIGSGTAAHCYLLAGLAALVLLVAAINFVNLALSRAISRTLEIGMRKVIGATRPQLASQFLAEAVVVSLIAVVGGMALAEVLLPTFNQVVHRQLDLEWLSLETGAGALTLALTVGLLSGLYPARVISRHHPIRALGGSAPQLSRGRIGRGLIVLQFVMSTFLVVVTITMTRQLGFMHTNLGFDGERVVLALSKDALDPLQIERLAGEIESRRDWSRGWQAFRPPPARAASTPDHSGSVKRQSRSSPFV
jgi:putative ABC transport system permease protein